MPVFDHVHLKEEDGRMILNEEAQSCNVCLQNIKEDHANKIFRFSEYGDSSLRNKDGSPIELKQCSKCEGKGNIKK